MAKQESHTSNNNKSTARNIDFTAINQFSVKQRYHNNLYDYQQKNKELVYKEWESGLMSIMLQMPTGTGKTHLFSSLIKDIQDYFFNILETRTNLTYEEKKKYSIPKVLVLVHRKELVDQIHDTLVEKYHHLCGIVAGGIIYGEEKNVIVATTQTMGRRNRLEKWEQSVNFDFIIVDEAHHSTADSYQRIRKSWPNARLLGVSATPYRLNHQPFTDIYDKLILSDPVYKFIEKGYLCQYDYCSIKPSSKIQYQIDHLATDFSGDYDEQAMENLLNQDRIRASILGTYEKFAKGKKGIVYTINRLHNQMLAELFTASGYNVAYIDSQTPKEERKSIVQDFRDGKIEIIFNVNIFSEGFDCPDVEFIQLARPTKSLSMYLQQVGRGFRVAKGKEKVMFLDNVGLFNRFGLPSARRAWQHYFEGREDWQDEIGGENGTLGEPHDTGVSLTEGNEEVSMIFSSLNHYPAEQPVVVSETDQTESSDSNDENNTMEDKTTIVCKGSHYVLEDLTQREMAEMLLSIEETRQTKMIDTDELCRVIQEHDRKRRKELEDFITGIFDKGYTKEEIMAALKTGDINTIERDKTVIQNQAPIGKGLYVITKDGDVIQESTGSGTLLRALQTIGLKKVYETCWTKYWERENTMHGLISTEFNINQENRGDHPLEDNGTVYYVNTKTNTPRKLIQLENLNKALNLGWIVGMQGGDK